MMFTKSPGTMTPATPFTWSTEIVIATHGDGCAFCGPQFPREPRW